MAQITTSSVTPTLEGKLKLCLIAFLDDLSAEVINIFITALEVLKTYLSALLAEFMASLLAYDTLRKVLSPALALFQDLVSGLQNLPSYLPLSPAVLQCTGVTTILDWVAQAASSAYNIPPFGYITLNQITQDILDLVSLRAEILLLQQYAQQTLNLIDAIIAYLQTRQQQIKQAINKIP